ncbi:hypothetical protein [Glutamicibacter sp.]
MKQDLHGRIAAIHRQATVDQIVGNAPDSFKKLVELFEQEFNEDLVVVRR